MSLKLRVPGLVGCAFLAAHSPAQAHHSFAMFDQSKKSVIEGVVGKYVWTNPHVFIAVDVPTSAGKSKRYAIEAASTNMLARKGWKISSLKGGERIRVTYYPLKNGQPGGLLMTVRRSDGTILGL